MEKELDRMNKVLYSVVVSSCVTLTFGPLVAAILKYYPEMLTGSLHAIKVTELTLPINFLYPEEYANLATYIFLYALQTLYMYLFAGYMYCTLTSGLMAMKTTIYDMKELCLTVKEWDLHQNGFGRQIQSYGVSSLSTEFTDSKLLKSSLINVIKIHELICWKASNLNKNLEMMYTILNNTICFQICVCLYSASKMEDFVLKIEHILLVLPMASILFLYCFSAQQLLNEGENLRTALWESAFVDKPKWYKSSFFMIMIRNNKDLEIKPFGFYVLNLKTFATVMNAAYSYFNMLNSLNKRI
ncbi:uncharacterized protein LOC120353958 [Nilaparvata lugens]|uniref:uncharacterized protein LOC120353958 n=1 Tax=Nilaparvata lugens TaxID=108931 RepID=UPI00193E16B9|nr:uncharacterized protein LOC120353958 [Nilaparvata lugens]